MYVCMYICSENRHAAPNCCLSHKSISISIISPDAAVFYFGFFFCCYVCFCFCAFVCLFCFCRCFTTLINAFTFCPVIILGAVGHNVPTKATSNGTMCANGSLGTEGPEATETDSSGTGRMRKSLERNGSTQNDTVHLERRYETSRHHVHMECSLLPLSVCLRFRLTCIYCVLSQ